MHKRTNSRVRGDINADNTRRTHVLSCQLGDNGLATADVHEGTTDLRHAGQVDGCAVGLTHLVAAVHPPVSHHLSRRDALGGVLHQTRHDHFLHNSISDIRDKLQSMH